ncbi:MAG: hypothetical protein RIC55_32565 [Pirellulaceae bacterium]
MRTGGAILFYLIAVTLGLWFLLSLSLGLCFRPLEIKSWLNAIASGYGAWCLLRGAVRGDADAVNSAVWSAVFCGGLSLFLVGVLTFHLREMLLESPPNTDVGFILWTPLILLAGLGVLQCLLGLALWLPPVRSYLQYRAWSLESAALDEI